MSIIVGIISYVIFVFGILPIADVFAYNKKNIIPHIMLGVLIPYVHKVSGLVGMLDNGLYLTIMFFSRKEGFKDFEKKYPHMNDAQGIKIVNRANTFFFLVFIATYLLLNIELGVGI